MAIEKDKNDVAYLVLAPEVEELFVKVVGEFSSLLCKECVLDEDEVLLVCLASM